MPEKLPRSLEYQVFDPERQEIRVVVIEPPKHRYWLHALLFIATIFTTLCIGARLQYNFDNNLPAFSSAVSNDLDYWPWQWALQDWHRLLLGIPFSASLLAILTAHELGHFILCVRRRVYATLPFFIPAPTLIGTLGAFIRIKAPIRTRADLFDIGIAGPIAGFLVAVPVLFLGLLASKPLTPSAAHGDIHFGLPLIFSGAHWILSGFGHGWMGNFPLAAIYLSPMAVAAWVGMFATALNLLPGGQLDGGHIIFALKPSLHRPVSLLSIAILLPLSWYFWAGWLLWAVVLRMTGERHPDVPLHPGLDRKRKLLGAFALLMLILSLAPIPFRDQAPDNTLRDQGLKNILSDYRHERMQQQSK
ncbi:MAG TPA: site-2 protease family protein [Candidatus Limnocylindrales bacterium]|nr:site-2 protease family protein [Candidatus Limnocylindrales bacterium]